MVGEFTTLLWDEVGAVWGPVCSSVHSGKAGQGMPPYVLPSYGMGRVFTSGYAAVRALLWHGEGL